MNMFLTRQPAESYGSYGSYGHTAWRCATRPRLLQFGSRLHFKRCQALPKETPFPFFSGTPFLGPLVFFFFLFFS